VGVWAKRVLNGAGDFYCSTVVPDEKLGAALGRDFCKGDT